MKILVIFTGGTIGSRVIDSQITPDSEAKYYIVEQYRRQFGDTVELNFLEPYTILSENLTAKNLNLLIKTVKENINVGFDGIIVTHGTDTLQFSASALSFALGTACTPVLLVSSNYPPDDPRANGQAHFSAAIRLISERRHHGVLIPYRNVQGEVVFYQPHSIRAFAERDDNLGCITDCRYAVLRDDGEILILSAKDCFLKPRDFILKSKPEILVIDPHPADSYSYSLDGVNAVILRPYHSGTLPTYTQNFTSFCKRASAEGIPLFAVDAPGGTTYQSVSEFENLGLISLTDAAYINSYVKVWIGISIGFYGGALVKFVNE